MNVKKKAHCYMGHPRTAENVSKSANCKICQRVLMRRWRLRNPERVKAYNAQLIAARAGARFQAGVA